MANRLKSRSVFRSREGNKKLLVLVHGWTRSPADLESLVDLLSEEKELEGFDYLNFGYKASVFSNRRLDATAAGLSTEIGTYQNRHYEVIHLLGHSIGGLIVRRAYLIAKGKASSYDQGYMQQWANNVQRIVLLAAPNRGSSYTERSLLGRWYFSFVAMFGQLKLIRDAFKGSVFVTNLRIDWIRAMGELMDDAPEVVQVLGEDDKAVAKEDSEDLLQFKNAVIRIVSGEDHASIVRVIDRSELKYRVIRSSITEPITPYRTDAQKTVTEKPEAVVFLVHGIRDYGEWLERVQQKILAEIPTAVFVIASYKYFTINQFLWKPSRGRRVEIFRDQYTEALARYPDVPFDFIGHSFGTYILANSLKMFQSMRFDRVYFAGSVVPQDFDWTSLFSGPSPQVSVLRNDCAAMDYPVGFLCSALQVVWSNDLGIGGFRGFFPSVHAARLNQNRYFDGGHSAAVKPDANLMSIARFISGDSVDGDYPDPGGIMVNEPSSWFTQLSKIAPFLVPFLVLGILIVLGLLAYSLPFPWGAILSVAIIVYFLWRF